jgi:PAS domain S-box-containing protein
MHQTAKPRPFISLGILAAIVAISVLEFFRVGGAVLSMGYVPLVALAFIALGRRQGVFITILSTALMAADHGYHWISAENITLEITLERVLALGSIWLMALLLIRRERMYIALEDSRAQNEAILSSTRDGILTADADGVIVSANPAAEAMFDYPPGALRGMSLEQLMPDHHRAAHREALSGYVEGRIDGRQVMGVTREVDAQRRDGSVFPIEVTVSEFQARGRRLFSAVMRDVSERREGELRLRENQRAMSTLLSNLPGMAYRCLLDEHWTMLFVSQGCRALTGYEPHDLIQNRTTTYARLIYPDDRQMVTEAVLAGVRGDTSFQMQYRIVRAEGDIRWVWEQGRAVQGRGGHIRCLEGFITDITAQKRVEEALRESEARFRSIADSTPFMIWASGLDMGITFANLRVMQFTGLAYDDLVGSGWLSAIHPDDRERVMRDYAEAFHAWKPYATTVRLRRHDGQWRWVHINGVPRFAPGGDFMGYIGSSQDVTEQHEATLALAESEERFRSVANLTPAVIWMTDVETHCVFVNQTWEKLTGQTVAQAMGHGWLSVMHPEDRRAAWGAIEESLRNRQRFENEFRVKSSEGRWRTLLNTGAPRWDANGTYQGFVGSAVDITDRRQADQMIWQVARGISSATGDEFFRSLALHLSEALGADMVSIGQTLDNPATRIRTIAYVKDGAVVEDMEYELAGTPCAVALAEGSLACVDGVQEQFPYDDYLREHGAAAYVGQALRDSAGAILGVLWVVFRRPVEDITRTVSLLRIFAVRAAAESERRRATEALRQSEERFRLALDNSAIQVFQQDRDLRYTWMYNPLPGYDPSDVIGLTDADIFRPEEAALLTELKRGVMESGVGVRRQVVVTLDGRRLHFDLSVEPLRDAGGMVTGVTCAAVDVTERQRSAEALRESEERFRLSLKAGHIIVFHQDAQLRYTWIHNPAQPDAGEIVGRTDREWLPADEAEALERVKRNVLRTGVGAQTEVTLSPGGVSRTYDLAIEPEFNGGGAVIGLNCVANDITDRKAMEMALRNSEQRYRRLFEDAPIALMEDDFSGIREYLQSLADEGITDLQAHFDAHPELLQECHNRIRPLGINAAGRALLGVRSSADLALGIMPLSTPASYESFGKFVLALWAGCTQYEEQTTLMSLEGMPRQVVIYSMIAPGNEETWRLVITSMIDVTAQRKAEEALRQSESRFRHLFNESPMAKLELDVSAARAVLLQAGALPHEPLEPWLERHPELMGRCMEALRFGSINATALRVFRAASELALRNNIPALFTEATRMAFRGFLARLWSGESTYEVETTFLTLTGETRIGKAHCVRLTEPAWDWTQILIAIVDITESRQAEEELARAKRLETAGRLAGQIAHDFNNLLGPLVAYPEILQAKFPDEGRAHEMLRDMQEAALQIAEINQELLTLSRRGHYNTEPLELNKLVQKAMRTAEIPDTVAVAMDLAPGDIVIRGGGAQLMRVMLNLINNGIEAMDGVGELTVRTERLTLEGPLHRYANVTQGDYARVTVSDTGCGIPAGELDAVFEPLYTTKKTDRKRGTGLGLPVVNSVVEDHNGYVDVASTVGRGTTFSLYFPLLRDESASSAADCTIEDGHGERVMVIDDDPLQQRIAQTALERVGYRVSVAGSGEEALAFLADHPQDVVIIDMVMDGIDGAETLRRIRALYPEQRAMILTGYATPDRAQAALALGRCELLAKPIQVTALTHAIQRALSRRDDPANVDV